MLTSHRVRYESQGQGPDNITSINLDQISSSRVVKKGDIVLAIAAALLALTLILIPLSLVLLVFYMASFKHVLEVNAIGAKIRVPIAKDALEGAVDFMYELDVARSDLLLSR